MRCYALWFGILGLLVAATTARAETWLPVGEVSLAITPGSVLDFSALVPPGPAGRHGRVVVGAGGRLAFEKTPDQPQRFFAASLALSPPNGGFPSHQQADAYARQWRLHGYNMLRLFQVDATLMVGRSRDFDFDPEQLDRFHYLLSALKREGIYWVIDAATSDNGAYGGDLPNRWVDKHSLKIGVHFDGQRQAHWRRLVSELFGRINKYTGMRVLDDPALAGVILVNEGGIFFHAAVGRRGYPAGLEAPFVDWLKTRYRDDAMLRAAWGRELSDEASLNAGRVGLPATYNERSRRNGDFARFVADLEKRTSAWMTAHLRELGYRGLITSYNNWAFMPSDVVRLDFDWIDMHSYHDEPTNYVENGSEMKQTSAFDDTLFSFRQLAASRHGAKPFSVTEYGQPFWNMWRREAGILVGAYAAFQNWDMICQFGENSIELGHDPRAVSRKRAIFPFGVGLDPVTRATETLAALLFMRADVRPARHSIALSLSVDDALVRDGGLGTMPSELSRLAFVSAIGLHLQQGPTGGNGARWARKNVDVGSGRGGYLDRATRVLGWLVGVPDARAGYLVDELRSEGLLASANRSDPAAGVYQSDTDELLLEAKQRRFRVVTPLTEAIVFDQGAGVVLGKTRVLAADGPALISVSSMDARTLDQSQRLLAIVATDAINSGMTFADRGRTRLTNLGSLPPRIRAAKVTVELQSAHAQRLRAYALDLTGKRGGELAVERGANSVRITLDNTSGPHGPTTFFELAAEG